MNIKVLPRLLPVSLKLQEENLASVGAADSMTHRASCPRLAQRAAGGAFGEELPPPPPHPHASPPTRLPLQPVAFTAMPVRRHSEPSILPGLRGSQTLSTSDRTKGGAYCPKFRSSSIPSPENQELRHQGSVRPCGASRGTSLESLTVSSARDASAPALHQTGFSPGDSPSVPATLWAVGPHPSPSPLGSCPPTLPCSFPSLHLLRV